MAIVYQDGRKPTLRYNFSTGSAKNEPKRTHVMTGKAKQHSLPKCLVTARIRTLSLS